jgi:hypothetical protein
VLVRETGPDGWLRVSVGTPADMAAFRTALTEVLAGESPGARPDQPGQADETDRTDETGHPGPRRAGLEAT